MKKSDQMRVMDGSAGFLYALLEMNRHAKGHTKAQAIVELLHATILKTVKFMTGANNRTQMTTIQQNSNANVTVTSTKKTKAFQLKYTDKEGHLGAMYGTCGILYMLMKAV